MIGDYPPTTSKQSGIDEHCLRNLGLRPVLSLPPWARAKLALF